MKLLCKLFGHKWRYYKKSGDESLFQSCKNCGLLSYKNKITPGWVMMFEHPHYQEKGK